MKKLLLALPAVLLAQFLLPVAVFAQSVSCCSANNQELTAKSFCQSNGDVVKTIITLPPTCMALDPGFVCCETSSKSATPPPAASASGTPSAPPSPGSDMKLYNPLGENTTILDIIRNAISAFLGVVGGIALLVFIYGGAVYMTSGSSDRVGQARDTIKYAAIGLVIIMFAYTITNTFFYVLAGQG